MRFSAQFSTLSINVLAALAITAVAQPVAPIVSDVQDAFAVVKRGSEVARSTGTDSEGPAAYVVSFDEMKHWIATTDASLTFIGDPINELSVESAQITTVTYCNKRSASVCGGDCTVYTGSQNCLNAPDTECLFATQNVAFCDHTGCGGSCNNFDECGTLLDNGFCYTPGTKSINVSSN